MNTLTPLRIHLLRAMYLLMFVGLGLTIWPDFIKPANPTGDAHSVITAILVAFSLMALLGLRYPTKMIPILLFELLWKSLWIANYATRLWLGEGLGEYAAGVLGACLVGVALTPIAIPWKHVIEAYLTRNGEPWFPKAEVKKA